MQDILAAATMTAELEDFFCEKMPLLDPATKLRVGSGIDCLYLIPGGVVAVSFFVLPGGSLVNAGLTSLGAFTLGIGDNPVIPGDPSSPPHFS